MTKQRPLSASLTGLCLTLMASMLTGCAENGPSLEYSALVAELPDFQANANPVYHYPEDQDPPPADDLRDPVRPVVDLPTEPPAKATDVADSLPLNAPEAQSDEGTAVARPATESPSTGSSAVADAALNPPSQPSADGVAQPVIGEPDATAEPREIRVLIAEKRFRDENGALRVSYDDVDLLKVLNMEPVPADAADYFPAWLKDLDGQRIRIRGFMYPTFEATGLTRFTLARDNGICCFVRQPLIYDVIGVDLADGVTTDYIDNKPFDVEGVFRIQPEADDTELYQLYRITDAKVVQ
ncbi:MAG: hypothetical protein NXI04_00845 [Planctomycetaceae bacterium]|nr:hypothetical protein [Planctomycetaceae bacterium]